MVPLESSHVQEFYPSFSLDKNSVEFEFKIDRSTYLDMRDTHLQIKVALQKRSLFDDSTKKDDL